MQGAGSSRHGAANSGRTTAIAEGIQQICDILGQGEDSGTPSQQTELRSKLRTFLLQLLDQSVSSSPSSPRELAAVLQLLKLTLDKVPHWLTSESNTLLLEFLERLVPMLVRPLTGKVWADLLDAMGSILLRIAESDHDQFLRVLDSLCDLFTGELTIYIHTYISFFLSFFFVN